MPQNEWNEYEQLDVSPPKPIEFCKSTKYEANRRFPFDHYCNLPPNHDGPHECVTKDCDVTWTTEEETK